MSRHSRIHSETGIYHIVFRGINHCHLFEEQEDFEKFLDILSTVKEQSMLEVYAYCLMNNHVHLLLKEGLPGDIGNVMKRLLSPYAFWFNRKYQRNGALIANRFKSECVERDDYLLALVRYIHQNPVVAGAASDCRNYRWSSFLDYVEARAVLTDTSLVLEMLSPGHGKASKGFLEFHDTIDNSDHSLSNKRRLTEEEVRSGMLSFLGGMEPSAICGLPRLERNNVLVALRKQGYTINQIERATGISRGIIARCEKKQ